MQTHEDLEVGVDLAELVSDPEGDPVFVQVIAAQHGTASYFDHLATHPYLGQADAPSGYQDYNWQCHPDESIYGLRHVSAIRNPAQPNRQ